MHWRQNGYVWAEFSAQAANWKSKSPNFTDIECRQLASATHVDQVILTEVSPPAISDLDFAYNSGNPATIVVGHKVAAVYKAPIIRKDQTFQMKVSLLTKKDNFYFLTFTGPLSIDFSQNTTIGSKASQQAPATEIQNALKTDPIDTTA